MTSPVRIQEMGEFNSASDNLGKYSPRADRTYKQPLRKQESEKLSAPTAWQNHTIWPLLKQAIIEGTVEIVTASEMKERKEKKIQQKMKEAREILFQQEVGSKRCAHKQRTARGQKEIETARRQSRSNRNDVCEMYHGAAASDAKCKSKYQYICTV